MTDSWKDHPAITDSWDLEGDFDLDSENTSELDQLKNAIDELRLRCDRQEKQIDALCLRCDRQEQKIAYLEKKQISFRPPQAPRRSHITWDPKPKEEAKPVTKPVTKPVATPIEFGSKISFREFEKTAMASLPQPKETRENPKEEGWQEVKSQRRVPQHIKVPKKEDNILHGSFKFWNSERSFGFIKADDGSEYYCDSRGLGSRKLLDLLESNGWSGKRFRFSLVELERGGVMRTYANNVELV